MPNLGGIREPGIFSRSCQRESYLGEDFGDAPTNMCSA